MNKKGLLFVFIITTSLLLRLILLPQIPPGVANDELNIILNAQSLLKTGQNIPGVITGALGTAKGDISGGIHSEISSYLIIPFLLFGFNLLTVKLAFVAASLGIITLSLLVVKRLVNNQAALYVALLSAVNPWLIFFGRSAYESILAAFFYLLAIYLVLSLKRWQIFWSIPVFIAGLLSYFSAKTLFLPLALISIMAVKFFKIRESLKPILALNLILFIFLSIYGFMLLQKPAGGRFQELENQNTKSIVDSKRTTSLHFPLAEIFENKFTEDLRIRLKASLGGLSTTFLFLDGQPENIPSLSIPDHGPLYLIDLPLIIASLVYLARINLRLLIFFLGLVGTTLIPNFLNLAGTTYMIRTVIYYPIMVMLSGIGFYYLGSMFLSKKIIGHVLFLVMICAYIFSVANFLYQYFGRLPIDKNTGWFLQDRVLTKYVSLLQTAFPNTNISVVTNSPKQTFYRYLFFSNNYIDSKNVEKINKQLAAKNYSMPNLLFTASCPDLQKEDAVYLIDSQTKCQYPHSNTISSLKDGGDQYTIINDKLCEQISKFRYPLIKDYNLLDIESLSVKDLCQNFITNSASPVK